MATENENGQERTEEATPKRRQEAREKGEIARSLDLNTLLMLLASGSALFFMGDNLIAALTTALRDCMVLDRGEIFNPASMMIVFMKNLDEVLSALIPFFVVLLVTAVVAPTVLGGWTFSNERLKLDFKKLDPIKGMGRVFSLKGLMELGKALAKFTVVGTVGYWLLIHRLPEFEVLGNLSIEKGMGFIGSELIWDFLLLSSALILIVAADVPFQLWDFSRKQKMTLQEVKDENKQTEGSPELRGRIRQTQREISQRRMMAEVPKADVVVTNPTHYAVALRYDQDNMSAPVVVAMGADEVAGHIRRIAQSYDVPILSAPPLARALFYNCKLDKEIPAGLYLAVAQVLAYVYQLNHYYMSGGIAPTFDPDVEIPDDLKRDQ